MNVALGFDTFLVMRHGLMGANEAQRTLGCYYCNDIVAPMDSLSDRTLDQMCTVTRPGIASIASSTAVELLVSLLQHPLTSAFRSLLSWSFGKSTDEEVNSGNAPSELTTRQDGDGSCLGIVPHQIRGQLSQFDNMKMTGAASEYCTACSAKVGSSCQSLDRLTRAHY